MKKSMLLASLAALTLSGNAMALVAQPGALLPVCIASQPAGAWSIAPLGPAQPGNIGSPVAPFGACNYHVRWSPNLAVGPFNALTCTITEISTSSSLGCFLDAGINFPTLVAAGKDTCTTFGLMPTVCSGFDQYGISHFSPYSVDLLLAETALPPVKGAPGIPLLTGLVTFKDFFFPMPQSITVGC